MNISILLRNILIGLVAIVVLLAVAEILYKYFANKGESFACNTNPPNPRTAWQGMQELSRFLSSTRFARPFNVENNHVNWWQEYSGHKKAKTRLP